MDGKKGGMVWQPSVLWGVIMKPIILYPNLKVNNKKKEIKKKKKVSSTQGTEAERSLWIGGQPGLYREFLDSQGSILKPCFKKVR